MPRFVILLHETPPDFERATHWDLMLECDDVLRTWALLQPPCVEGAQIAEPLSDHRVDYLEYEGPVSGGRGNVARWDQGEYEIVRQCESELIIRLEGSQITGDVTISVEPDAPGNCCYTFTAAERSE